MLERVSGSFFLRGGFPFSVHSNIDAAGFTTAVPAIYANAVPGQNPYTRSNVNGVTPARYAMAFATADRGCRPTAPWV